MFYLNTGKPIVNIQNSLFHVSLNFMIEKEAEHLMRRLSQIKSSGVSFPTIRTPRTSELSSFTRRSVSTDRELPSTCIS